jgi:hypothetical protein
LVAILCRFFSCLFFMLVISVYLGQWSYGNSMLTLAFCSIKLTIKIVYGLQLVRYGMKLVESDWMKKWEKQKGKGRKNMGRKEDFVVQYYKIDAMPNTMNLDGGWWLHQYTCCFRPVNSKKSILCKMT